MEKKTHNKADFKDKAKPARNPESIVSSLEETIIAATQLKDKMHVGDSESDIKGKETLDAMLEAADGVFQYCADE